MGKGMGVMYCPVWPHAMPPQVSVQLVRGTNWELKASLHWKDMTQLPIITRFYVIAETVLSAETADAE